MPYHVTSELHLHTRFRMQDERVYIEAKLPRRAVYLYRVRAVRKQIENFTLICRNDHASTAGGHLPQENTATFSDYSIDLTPRRSPYWPMRCTCALIKWESARFHEVGNSIAVGLDMGKLPYSLFTSSFLSLSVPPILPTPRKRSYTVLGVVLNPAATLIHMGRTFHCVRTY